MNIQTLSLPVILPPGEECLRCIGRLQVGLTQIKGVQEASVNNAYDTLRIVFDPNLVSFRRIESATRNLGARISVNLRNAAFALDRLDSPDTTHAIEQMLSTLPGVLWIGTDFISAQVRVEYDGNRLQSEEIVKRLTRLGFRTRRLDAVTPEAPADEKKKRDDSFDADISPARAVRRHALLLIAIALALSGLIVSLLPSGEMSGLASRGLYGAAMALGGWQKLRDALFALHERTTNLSVFLLLAVAGALAIGQWGEAAFAVLLFGLGSAFQDTLLLPIRARQRAQPPLPRTAVRVQDGRDETVPLEQIQVGERILVSAGETVCFDGEVVGGGGDVIEPAILSGGTNQEKRPGDRIFAGTRNGRGLLDVRVTALPAETMRTRLTAGVGEAQTKRSPREKRVEQQTQLYARVVGVLALIVAVAPPLLLPGGFAMLFPLWAHRALFLLMAACPFGFLFAMPAAYFTALLWAFRQGILIKGANALEALGMLHAIVYDKTGTLTQERVVVVDVVPLGEMTGAEILGMAAAIERASRHPLALAIREEAAAHPLAASFPVSGFEELPGLGGYALVNDVPTLIGNARLFQSQNVTLPRTAQEVLADAEANGKTAVLLGDGTGLHGILLFSVTPRLENKNVFAELTALGIRYQGALSGDSARVLAHIAAELGLDHVDGGLLPEQKAQRVKALQARYGTVAMVGIGNSDMFALAASDVAVTLGGAMYPHRLESGDIVLLRDELRALPALLRLSRETRRIISHSLIISSLLQGALLLLGLAVSLPLWVAALAQSAASLFALKSCLRPHDDVVMKPAEKLPAEATATEEETLLELVFIHDSTVDEQPKSGYVYPNWERFVVPFNGKPLRFGRKMPSSVLTIQIEDEAMSRMHGEIRLEGRRPVLVDLGSTNGIRRNGQTSSALIPPERPVPIRFGDVLRIGRNTRIEIYPPGGAKAVILEASPPALAESRNGAHSALVPSGHSSAVTQTLNSKQENEGGKSGTPAGS